MEIQRAPYLKYLNHKSDIDKFVERKIKSSNCLNKTGAEYETVDFKTVFTAAELEHLILGIKEEKEKVELLENLLKKIREDLIMRSFNDNGINVVDISASIWIQINSAINAQEAHNCGDKNDG